MGSTVWRFYDTLRVFRGNGWDSLPALPTVLADACMVVTNTDHSRRLWVMGGSEHAERNKADVWTLNLDSPEDGWTPMPPLMDDRRWQSCTTTVLDGNIGILVVGGYYNGKSSMWLPLADRFGNSLEIFGPQRNNPRWEWLSSLSEERKWAPAAGYVGSHYTLAGGAAYGDDGVEMLFGRYWMRSRVKTHYKREFALESQFPATGSLTVDSGAGVPACRNLETSVQTRSDTSS